MLVVEVEGPHINGNEPPSAVCLMHSTTKTSTKELPTHVAV